MSIELKTLNLDNITDFKLFCQELFRLETNLRVIPNTLPDFDLTFSDKTRSNIHYLIIDEYNQYDRLKARIVSTNEKEDTNPPIYLFTRLDLNHEQKEELKAISKRGKSNFRGIQRFYDRAEILELLSKHKDFNIFWIAKQTTASAIELGSLDDTTSDTRQDQERNNKESLFINRIEFDNSTNLVSTSKTEKIAKEIYYQIKHIKDENGMFGIFGHWGRGKTFLWNQIKLLQIKDSEQIFIPIEFKAWKYQDTPASWAYLYETLSKEYLKEPCWGIFKKIWLNIHRDFKAFVIDLFSFGVFWGLLSIIISQFDFTGNSSISSIINSFKDKLGWLIGSGAFLASLIRFYKKNGHQAKDLIKKYTNGVSYNKVLGLQAEIEKELVNLLKVWIKDKSNKRILLFIDDIDRCDESKIIELIDALRVMMDHEEISKRLLIIAAIDDRILMRAIRVKLKSSILNESPEDDVEKKLDRLVVEYMDKLFITGIKLTKLTPGEKFDLWGNLTKGKVNRKGIRSFKTTVPGKPRQTKNVDYSSLDEEGKVKIVDQESGTNKEEGLDSKYLKLNKEQDDLLFSLFQEVDNITPRQTLIFFYRFCFALNISHRVYGDIRLNNKYNTELAVKIIRNTVGDESIMTDEKLSDTNFINEIVEMVVPY